MVKKFEQLNNNQNLITKDLQVKDQDLKQIKPEQYNSKLDKIISETAWITVTPTSSGGAKNTSEGHILPELVSFSQNLDFHLDQKFIPYLKTEILFKGEENVNLVGVLPYIQEGYENDYVEVYGDGTELIYQGYPRAIYYEYDQYDLDDGLFQEEFTKKVYRGVIEYTRGGDLYKVDGRVIRIEIINMLGTGCGGGNYDYLDCYIDPGYTGSQNYAKFHELLTNSVDITGILYHFTFSSNPTPPPSCIQNYPVVTVSPYRHTWTFGSSEVDDYRIKVKQATLYKWVSGAWVAQSYGDFTVDTDTDTVSSKAFQFVGYWLFYEEDTYTLFGIRNKTPLSYEGIYRRKELYNLPVAPNRVWTTIVFKRHPDDHPLVVQTNATAISSKQHGLFRLYKTTDGIQDYYRMNVNGSMILSALAHTKTTRQVPVYDDVYNQDATTYVPTESHTLKNIDYYTTEKLPIEYKIRLSLINPYEFSERQNYEL